jgi:calpain-15
MDLTGAPYKTIRFDDADLKPKIANGELWKDLLRFDQENFIMSASTPGEDTQTEGNRRQKNSTGLVAGHAYTLVAVKQSKRGPKLVKLRNPWGNMEWTGDWSDSSPLWTQEMQVNEI